MRVDVPVPTFSEHHCILNLWIAFWRTFGAVGSILNIFDSILNASGSFWLLVGPFGSISTP